MGFSDMVNSGYFMYMAEAEGLDYLVGTRDAKLNAIKQELSYSPSYEELKASCLKHGIEMLSEKEYQYLLNRR